MTPGITAVEFTFVGSHRFPPELNYITCCNFHSIHSQHTVNFNHRKIALDEEKSLDQSENFPHKNQTMLVNRYDDV